MTALALNGVAAASFERSALDGLWRSDGYGLLLEFQGAEMRISQTTRISCLRAVVARRAAGAPTRRQVAYTVDRGRSLPVVDVDSGLLTVEPGRTPGVKRLRIDGSISDVVLRRVDRPPPHCTRPPDGTPLGTFDVFWQTYHEHYPFFRLRGVDWNAVRARYRPQVTPATTRRQLARIFAAMIAPLEDAHTFVVGGGREFSGERPDPQPLTDAEYDRVDRIVARRLRGPLRSWADGEVSFGRLPKGLGYLRIASFSDYTESGLIRDELRELDRALDAAFARRLRGLVIDIRVNDGGSDVLGVAIARRLTRRRYVAYSKVARDDPDRPRRFTRPQRVLVRPSSDTSFLGPVALLTSRYSVSAAETFAQALLGRRPRVARIGERTQGVFSDVLIRVLPNRFRFGLPNEVFLTRGKSFEAVGIRPTIRTGLVFERSDLRTGRDPELDRAIALLSRRLER